jgi:hypothetical protein
MEVITMKMHPIGIQSFIKMREDNFYYVDKTAMVAELVNQGGRCHLSDWCGIQQCGTQHRRPRVGTYP